MCDAKIAPMVCGHLDRNALARAVTALLAGDLANLVTSTEPAPVPGPRCTCDEHPPPRRAPIPGALPSTSQPAACPPPPASPPPPARSPPEPSPAPPPHRSARHHRVRPEPGQPAQPADPRRTGPAPGHPAPLRRQPALRPHRARVISADPAHRRVLPRTQPPPRPRPAHRASPAPPPPRRHQARPALLLPRLHRTPRPLPRPPRHPPVTRRPDPPGQPDPFVHFSPPDRRAPLGLDADLARGRQHHRDQPRRPQDLAQPRTTTRPGHPLG